MLFRRLVTQALICGLCIGLVFSLIQQIFVTPLILEAEQYEISEDIARLSGTAASAHAHNNEAWAPKDGSERSLFTYLSNILATSAYALLMMAFMTLRRLSSNNKVTENQMNATQGLLWGTAGFLAFFALPGIGLPPEIPGVQAAAVASRQLWWILTVSSACVAFALLAFAPVKWKGLSVLFLSTPFLFGAPHSQGPLFAHPDPAAVADLERIHHSFITMSSMSNGVFWLMLGLASALVVERFIVKGLVNDNRLNPTQASVA